jgi:hypothetical protein
METITKDVHVNYNLMEDALTPDRCVGVHIVEDGEYSGDITLDFFNLYPTMMQLFNLHQSSDEEIPRSILTKERKVFSVLRSINLELLQNRHDAYSEQIVEGLVEYRNLFFAEELKGGLLTLMGQRVSLTTPLVGLVNFLTIVDTCTTEELEEDVEAPVWKVTLQVNKD